MNKSHPPHITSKYLSALPHIRHGFFTRQGGISTGIYESLNCGTGSSDDPDKVTHNRKRAALTICATQLITPHQTHSTKAVFVRSLQNETIHSDALLTDQPHLAIGVLSADCVPILLADRTQPLIAAIHAGWRGAIGGITDAAITQMTAKGADPQNIVAAIGPHISRNAYQVGGDMQQTALAQDHHSAPFFSQDPANSDKLLFDLGGYLNERIANLISQVEYIPECTFFQPQKFFSHRYNQAHATNMPTTGYGRQISIILLS